MARETVPKLAPIDSFDFEDEGSRMASFVALAEWIEAARCVLKDLQLSAQISPELRANLGAYDIRYSDAAWSDEQSGGLRLVMQEVASIGRFMTGAGLEMYAKARTAEAGHA